ncbi:uncharacterized protein PG998_006191 [Apiospora kogelbergensis]|uniref:uncharacterized protein n=1 Tax=Apiospora kogelbergensis TaxID=1337665 RepID=UPI00313277B4
MSKHFDLKNCMPACEAFGCGALTMGVIARDHVRVKSYLERYPSWVTEENVFGQGPFEVAVYENTLPQFPSLLESTYIPGIIRRESSSGTSQLYTALSLTGEHCRVKFSMSDECTHCCCSDSFRMVLEAGAVLSQYELGQPLKLSGSARSWRVFLSHLKPQRQKLKDVVNGSDIWTLQQRLRVLPQGAVLDLQAGTIFRTLKQHKVQVPIDPILSKCWDTKLDEYPTVHFLLPHKVQIAEMAFQLGFEDVDYNIQCGTRLPPLLIPNEPEYTKWLIERGAKLKRLIWPSADDQSPPPRGIFSAHYVMYNLPLPYDGGGPWCPDPTTVSILRWIMPLDARDSCDCACSIEGCTPLLYKFKDNHLDIGSSKTRTTILSIIPQGLSVSLMKTLYLDTMRFACFTALGLTHTCCNARAIITEGAPYFVKDQGDVEEIQEEEGDLIELLSELVHEFWDRISQMDGHNEQLRSCWEDYWTDRVARALQALEGSRMTEEEKQGAESVGVVWESGRMYRSECECKGENSQHPNETGARAAGPHDNGTLEYCEHELDLIAEEL